MRSFRTESAERGKGNQGEDYQNRGKGNRLRQTKRCKAIIRQDADGLGRVSQNDYRAKLAYGPCPHHHRSCQQPPSCKGNGYAAHGSEGSVAESEGNRFIASTHASKGFAGSTHVEWRRHKEHCSNYSERRADDAESERTECLSNDRLASQNKEERHSGHRVWQDQRKVQGGGDECATPKSLTREEIRERGSQNNTCNSGAGGRDGSEPEGRDEFAVGGEPRETVGATARDQFAYWEQQEEQEDGREQSPDDRRYAGYAHRLGGFRWVFDAFAFAVRKLCFGAKGTQVYSSPTRDPNR